MPINFPQKNDYSELLNAISKLTLTGDSGSGFRYAKSAEISLPPNEESIILGGTIKSTIREIYLLNNSDQEINLFWNDGISVTPIPEPLQPNEIYRDFNDGGLELQAKSSSSSIDAQLKIAVRDIHPITYQVGLEEMIPLKILLYAQTDRDYFQGDSDPSNFGNNLNRLFGSNQSLTGYKIFSIAQSTPGKELEFKIESSLALPIAFMYFDPFELALQGLKIASDVLNPELEDLPSDFVGRITREGKWASYINSLSESIKLKPNRCEFMGRFLSLNPETSYFDTAVITGYAPNPTNIYDGGTVTLGGF